MNVLVTGGAGYIGSHAVRELGRAGHPVWVLDNLSYGHREFVDASKLVVGDIADTALVEQLVDEQSIEAVMHFAAYAYVGESVTDPSRYYRNNVAATIHFLDLMVRKKIKYFVFSSTCATYGEPGQIPLVENHPQWPVNPYGWTKLMVERILDDYDLAYGLKSARLRYFNAAGADPDGGIGEDHTPETHLIPLVLDAVIGRRSEIIIHGDDYNTQDGTCIRDYIHVTDLAKAHVLALDRLIATQTSDTFNLGNGRGFSVRQVIDSANKITGLPVPFTVGPRRAGDPAVLVGSSAKAERLLGWKPQWNTLEAILETAWLWHQHRFGS